MNKTVIETTAAPGAIGPYSQGIAGAGGAVHAFSTRLGGVSTGIYASLNLSLIHI